MTPTQPASSNTSTFQHLEDRIRKLLENSDINASIENSVQAIAAALKELEIQQKHGADLTSLLPLCDLIFDRCLSVMTLHSKSPLLAHCYLEATLLKALAFMKIDPTQASSLWMSVIIMLQDDYEPTPRISALLAETAAALSKPEIACLLIEKHYQKQDLTLSKEDISSYIKYLYQALIKQSLQITKDSPESCYHLLLHYCKTLRSVLTQATQEDMNAWHRNMLQRSSTIEAQVYHYLKREPEKAAFTYGYAVYMKETSVTADLIKTYIYMNAWETISELLDTPCKHAHLLGIAEALNACKENLKDTVLTKLLNHIDCSLKSPQATSYDYIDALSLLSSLSASTSSKAVVSLKQKASLHLLQLTRTLVAFCLNEKDVTSFTYLPFFQEMLAATSYSLFHLPHSFLPPETRTTLENAYKRAHSLLSDYFHQLKNRDDKPALLELYSTFESLLSYAPRAMLLHAHMLKIASSLNELALCIEKAEFLLADPIATAQDDISLEEVATFALDACFKLEDIQRMIVFRDRLQQSIPSFTLPPAFQWLHDVKDAASYAECFLTNIPLWQLAIDWYSETHPEVGLYYQDLLLTYSHKILPIPPLEMARDLIEKGHIHRQLGQREAAFDAYAKACMYDPLNQEISPYFVFKAAFKVSDETDNAIIHSLKGLTLDAYKALCLEGNCTFTKTSFSILMQEVRKLGFFEDALLLANTMLTHSPTDQQTLLFKKALLKDILDYLLIHKDKAFDYYLHELEAVGHILSVETMSRAYPALYALHHSSSNAEPLEAKKKAILTSLSYLASLNSPAIDEKLYQIFFSTNIGQSAESTILFCKWILSHYASRLANPGHRQYATAFFTYVQGMAVPHSNAARILYKECLSSDPADLPHVSLAFLRKFHMACTDTLDSATLYLRIQILLEHNIAKLQLTPTPAIVHLHDTLECCVYFLEHAPEENRPALEDIAKTLAYIMSASFGHKEAAPLYQSMLRLLYQQSLYYFAIEKNITLDPLLTALPKTSKKEKAPLSLVQFCDNEKVIANGIFAKHMLSQQAEFAFHYGHSEAAIRYNAWLFSNPDEKERFTLLQRLFAAYFYNNQIEKAYTLLPHIRSFALATSDDAAFKPLMDAYISIYYLHPEKTTPLLEFYTRFARQVFGNFSNKRDATFAAYIQHLEEHLSEPYRISANDAVCQAFVAMPASHWLHRLGHYILMLQHQQSCYYAAVEEKITTNNTLSPEEMEDLVKTISSFTPPSPDTTAIEHQLLRLWMLLASAGRQARSSMVEKKPNAFTPNDSPVGLLCQSWMHSISSAEREALRKINKLLTLCLEQGKPVLRAAQWKDLIYLTDKTLKSYLNRPIITKVAARSTALPPLDEVQKLFELVCELKKALPKNPQIENLANGLSFTFISVLDLFQSNKQHKQATAIAEIFVPTLASATASISIDTLLVWIGCMEIDKLNYIEGFSYFSRYVEAHGADLFVAFYDKIQKESFPASPLTAYEALARMGQHYFNTPSYASTAVLCFKYLLTKEVELPSFPYYYGIALYHTDNFQQAFGFLLTARVRIYRAYVKEADMPLTHRYLGLAAAACNQHHIALKYLLPLYKKSPHDAEIRDKYLNSLEKSYPNTLLLFTVLCPFFEKTDFSIYVEGEKVLLSINMKKDIVFNKWDYLFKKHGIICTKPTFSDNKMHTSFDYDSLSKTLSAEAITEISNNLFSLKTEKHGPSSMPKKSASKKKEIVRDNKVESAEPVTAPKSSSDVNLATFLDPSPKPQKATTAPSVSLPVEEKHSYLESTLRQLLEPLLAKKKRDSDAPQLKIKASNTTLTLSFENLALNDVKTLATLLTKKDVKPALHGLQIEVKDQPCTPYPKAAISKIKEYCDTLLKPKRYVVQEAAPLTLPKAQPPLEKKKHEVTTPNACNTEDDYWQNYFISQGLTTKGSFFKQQATTYQTGQHDVVQWFSELSVRYSREPASKIIKFFENLPPEHLLTLLVNASNLFPEKTMEKELFEHYLGMALKDPSLQKSKLQNRETLSMVLKNNAHGFIHCLSACPSVIAPYEASLPPLKEYSLWTSKVIAEVSSSCQSSRSPV